MNIQDISKPYFLKRNFFTSDIYYEETLIRKHYLPDYAKDIQTLLNAAYLEGWLKGSIYGIN